MAAVFIDTLQHEERLAGVETIILFINLMKSR
jgi:hypothetical protein